MVGPERFSTDPTVLEAYESDLSYGKKGAANCVVKPFDSQQVSAVLSYCNEKRIPVTPCSSSVHFYGASVPLEGGVVMDMRGMNRIFEIDEDNRRTRFEAGVNWGMLTGRLREAGYRVIMPLAPPAERSVLTDFLEREEPVNQVYDYGEPLQAMEVVWPTGEIFRLGSASVEGYPQSPSKGGNPSGPGLDFYRFFQCAQGTFGVVTWTNLKIESIPRLDKVFFLGSSRLDSLIAFLYRILPRRIGQEVLILNKVDMSALLAQRWPGDYEDLLKELPPWTLTIVISGLKRRPEEKIAYEEKFLREVVKNEFSALEPRESLAGIPDLGKRMLDILRNPWPVDRPYWKCGLKGAFKSLFFHCRPAAAEGLISLVAQTACSNGIKDDLGIYIQPIEHNRACRPEVSIFYDPNDETEKKRAEETVLEAASEILKRGAVITRPYGDLAPIVYERAATYAHILRRLKKVFDPNNIMNPSKLCF
jgi:FAD/FMN-containing dehydrogenase